MKAIGVFLLGCIGGVAAGVAASVIGAMVSEEVRARLDRLPAWLLSLAIRRLPAELRIEIGKEWRAELDYVLHRAKLYPVTRLIKGTRFTAGLLRTAPTIATALTATRRREPGSNGESSSVPPLPSPPVPSLKLAALPQVGDQESLRREAALNALRKEVERSPDLLANLAFLERAVRLLEPSSHTTGSFVRQFIKECMVSIPGRLKSENPRFENMTAHLDSFSAALELRYLRACGEPDQQAHCKRCGQPGIVHGDIDLGHTECYDNYYALCTNCFWSWHEETYTTLGYGDYLQKFDYQTNTYQ